MLERLNKVAEQVTTGMSRRQFLGGLGRGAMFVAAAVAAVLAISQTATAKPVFICGAYSGICAFQPLNSQCFDRDGGYGRCRKIRGTNDCHCYTGR